MKAQFKMLLAEDNAGDILLVREALKEHRVNRALRVRTDGAEAVALLRHVDADTVRQFLAGAEEAIPPVHTSVENVREA